MRDQFQIYVNTISLRRTLIWKRKKGKESESERKEEKKKREATEEAHGRGKEGVTIFISCISYVPTVLYVQ